MGENHFAPMPAAVYGVVLLMAAIAYCMLQRAIIARRGPRLGAAARGRQATGRASCRRCSTSLAIASTFWSQWIAEALYVLVALIWLIPDRRIERALQARSPAS